MKTMKSKIDINKVVVVGTGMVGSSYAYSLINQGLVDELVLIDMNEKQAEANARDLRDSCCFLPRQPKIYSGSYNDVGDADIICITAGLAQKPGQSRLDLVQANANIMKSIVTQIMASGFDGILLIAANPVDLMSYVAHKVSGLPKNQVIGSGTTLDSARFRQNLAEYTGYNPTNIHAYIVGEHGDSSLPLWSTSTVGQKNLLDVIKDDNLDFEKAVECFEDAKNAAYKIIEGKGSTYYGIGIALTRITKAILFDENSILTTSSLLQGQYGIEDLYIPIPTIINRQGAKKVQEIILSNNELKGLKASADNLKEILNGVQL